MKISVIIPNFNGEIVLNKFFPKVFKVLKEQEIILVDDASTDNSVLYIKSNFPKVNIIQRKINGGFSQSVNDGVKDASEELVLLLNTDVVPEKNFLGFLNNHFNDSKVFAVGCLQKSYTNNIKTFEGRGIGVFDKGFLIHSAGIYDRENSLWVSGGAGLFRKSMWIELGGLTNLYNPFYWEDIDISYRALKAGYKVLFERRSEVRHYHTQGAIMTRYSQKDVRVIAFRNQILFVWLNISDPVFLLNHFLYLPYHFLKTSLSLDLSFIKGFFQALLKIFAVISQRMKRKNFWLLKDKIILNSFKT